MQADLADVMVSGYFNADYADGWEVEEGKVMKTPCLSENLIGCALWKSASYMGSATVLQVLKFPASSLSFYKSCYGASHFPHFGHSKTLF